MTEWKQPKRRGVLAPEQTDFKARRRKAIARRHRAWLRSQASEHVPMDLDGGGVDAFDSLFD